MEPLFTDVPLLIDALELIKKILNPDLTEKPAVSPFHAFLI